MMKHEPKTELSPADVDAIVKLVANGLMVTWSISYTDEYTNVSWTFMPYDDDGGDDETEQVPDDLAYLQGRV
jgi:hypothetical protein